jgi:hypothetical protein
MRMALLLLAVLVSGQAWAYPENVRHGYTNCVSCHINPNGQGQLNEYGRQLSKAMQSYGKFFFEPGVPASAQTAAASEADTAGADSDRDPETEFLYGHFPRPAWLTLGGDLRFLQLFYNTPRVEEARFIVMQLDVEAAVTVGKLTLDATVGRIDPSDYGIRDPGLIDHILSRRHFALYQLTDQFFVMGGRFWKPHGILDPNHSSTVKEGIGWNFGSESYNLEAGYTGELLSVLAYADFGRFGAAGDTIEKGGGATASVALGGTCKVGASYFYGTTDFSKRHVFGPWGILGFTEHFYLRTENDFVLATPAAGLSSTGFASYNRLGYELVQGVHTYLEQGYNQLDFDSDDSRQQVYGVGLLYYPRTHWEFELDVQKRKQGVGPASLGFTDYIYLQAHYYL